MPPSRKEPAATAKGAATRAELLRIAADLFARKGYALMRMDDLIAASGLTKGAIYFHFGSKEELARAVVEDQKQRWLDRVRAALADAADPVEQLRLLNSTLTTMVAADSAAWSVVRLAQDVQSLGGPGAESIGPLGAWIALVADILGRARAADRITFAGTPEDLAVVLVAAYEGIKNLSEAMEPANPAAFVRRAEVFQQLVEAQLLKDAPDRV